MVIGHAYGAPSKSKLEDFIAPNVDRFLLKNKSKIQNIIFTGDVFSVPDSSKWENLFEKFTPAKIYVAPGNHDILRPDSREIFSKLQIIKRIFPYHLTINKNLSVVVDDSISQNWRAGKDLKIFINSITAENIFVARHNIPISQLLPYANSTAGNPNVPSVNTFVENFSTKQNFTWIIGDGGAFQSLPRITCHSFKNHRFIVNGIGEVENDTVLILHKGKIFAHIL
ncbi:metallophosphoesterase [Amylibacter sp.]|nr:metallophosphoesterase [Amylibacter sp.]